MIKSIVHFIARAHATYKVQHMNAVITAYADVVRQQATHNVPVIVDAYRDVALHIVQETEQNPQPLINLLTALNDAVEFYGPGIKAIVERGMNEVKREVDDTKFTAAVEALVSDTKDDHA